MSDNGFEGPMIDWVRPSNSIKLALAVLILIGSIGYLVSKFTGSPNWFPRSGAVIVIVGLLLESFPLLKIKYGDQALAWTPKEAPTNARWRVLIIAVGTLIWGFGDTLI